MSLDETRQSQRPYRYGMVLLCIGALINWLGLAENYVEPVRYIGVACIIAGALLICAAMCCWLQAPAPRPLPASHQNDDPIHVITVPSNDEIMQQKPPDYDSVAGAPPTYDDAIKLNPGHYFPSVHTAGSSGRCDRPDEIASDRISNNTHILSAAALNILLSPPGTSSRETSPGQLESVVVTDSRSQNITQIPKTPPPPYRPMRTVR